MSLDLPLRAGPRPQTTTTLPHKQVSQNPPAPLFAHMKAAFLDAPATEQGPSLISVPGAVALFVPPGAPCNGEACFRGREFAHIHPPSDGSFHMSLSPEDARTVLDRGWGELHPLALAGEIPKTVVMVYAPRDASEVPSILAIAAASRRFATERDQATGTLFGG